MIKFDTDKISGIIAIVSFISAIAAGLGAALADISPKYAAICLAVTSFASAFTKRVHYALPSRKKRAAKKLTSLLLICSFAAILTACPKEKVERSIRTAKEQSAVIKIHTLKIIQANIDAFNAGEISKERLAELTKLTGMMTDGIEFYSKAVRDAEKLFEGSSADRTTLEKLSSVFSERVVDVFLELVEKLKLLPASKAETVKTLLSGIRLAILAIQSAVAELKTIDGGRAQWI